MKHPALIRSFCILIALCVLYPLQSSAFVYFGGKVTNWQEQSACPVIQTANGFLDSVCGVTGGAVCLNLKYGDLTLQGGFAQPNALDAKFNTPIHIGALSISDREVPIPLHFYQSFLSYGFTQKNSWDVGEALDFTPSCNPCKNDIERKVLGLSGVNMDKMCNNLIVKTALSLSTVACDAALAAETKATANLCPTKMLCFVGTSHFGLPGVEFDLCHPGFSIGGFKL